MESHFQRMHNTNLSIQYDKNCNGFAFIRVPFLLTDRQDVNSLMHALASQTFIIIIVIILAEACTWHEAESKWSPSFGVRIWRCKSITLICHSFHFNVLPLYGKQLYKKFVKMKQDTLKQYVLMPTQLYKIAKELSNSGLQLYTSSFSHWLFLKLIGKTRTTTFLNLIYAFEPNCAHSLIAGFKDLSAFVWYNIACNSWL